MMEDYQPPFVVGSETSKRAADSIKLKAPTVREQVFDFIKRHPRSSDKDIQRLLPMNPNTQRPRRIELQRAGLIRSAGLDTTGKHTVYVTTGEPYPKNPPPGFWQAEDTNKVLAKAFRKSIVASLRAKHKRMASMGPGGHITTWNDVADWLEEER